MFVIIIEFYYYKDIKPPKYPATILVMVQTLSYIIFQFSYASIIPPFNFTWIFKVSK